MQAVRGYRFVEEVLGRCDVALCCQQEVDSLSRLVDSAVETFPDAFDLSARLIHPPAASCRPGACTCEPICR